MVGRTASEMIGDFVASYGAGRASPGVVHLVARAFVDTFGCAVAGRAERASHIIRDYALADGPGGSATVWATGERARPEDAALVNGVMAHVLDYDDAVPISSGHPSAVLLPALVALGEAEDATGGQIAAAYAVGGHHPRTGRRSQYAGKSQKPPAADPPAHSSRSPFRSAKATNSERCSSPSFSMTRWR